MDDSTVLTIKSNGKRLVNAERMVLVSKLMDFMSEGLYTDSELAKMTGTTRTTVARYKPFVDELIAKSKIDRNVIRNLQIRRTYTIIENLMIDLRSITEIKNKTLIYNQIYKFSSHLALITGLNVETHVTIDPTKLVIIRSNKTKTADRVVDVDAVESTDGKQGNPTDIPG